MFHPRSTAFFRLLAFTLFTLASLGCHSSPSGANNQKTDLPPLDQRTPAPELESGLGWLNTDRPFNLKKDLKGHVVLLDFWTYCCINCIHVLPDLKYLEHKYKDQPFMVIGVHSAKFENEGTRQNVRTAIHRYEIEHPVVVDDQMAIWDSYGVNSWPTLVLLDTEGRIVGMAPGEGNREPLDKAIAALLKEGKEKGKLAKAPVKFQRDGMVRGAGGLAFPGKVLADEKGKRLFISDSNHNRIVVSSWPDASGHSSLLKIIGQGEVGTKDGDASKAQFHHPQGMALNGNSLYIADTENHLLRQVDLSTWKVSTIAGTGKQVYDRTGGDKGQEQGLNSPWDLAFDAPENLLYIAMAGPHQLWKMDMATRKVMAFVGSGYETIADENFSRAALAQPSGLALDGKKLYFADSETSAVRLADLQEKRVSTLIGEGLFEFGDIDGRFPAARLQHPLGVSLWNGQLLVADTYNHKIKLLDPATKNLTTFLGTGKPAAGDGKGVGFYEPGGLHSVGDTLFVADTGNHRIVRVDLKNQSGVEVVVEGLEPPEMEGNRPALIVADPREVDPKKPLEVQAAMSLKKGFILNPESPSSLKISRDGKPIKTHTLHGLKGAMSLTLDPQALSPGKASTLEVVLRTAACTEEKTLCLPLSVRWQIPLTAKAGASNKIDLVKAQ